MSTYHDPRPIEIAQANGRLRKIWVHRDPTQGISDSGDSLSSPGSLDESGEDKDEDDATTPSPPPEPVISVPAPNFNRILANLNYLTKTVNQLGTQFEGQTVQIELMSEKIEKMEAQIAALRSKNSTSKAAIKSIEDNMDMAMQNLLDMWEDNEELERELEDLLADFGRA
ncbi:hypothetical protein BGZ96_002338, partial [Linnemannia gamsii]